MAEEKEICGSTPLNLKYGERFEGWHFLKSLLRRQSYPLNYKDFDLTYSFAVCDYNYKFIIPEKIEFYKGVITYTDADRLLGVFRFPRNKEGDFFTPLFMKEIQEKIQGGIDRITREMLELKPPVVFNAFKIPQFGFEFIDICDFNFNEILRLTDSDFVKQFRAEYEGHIEAKTQEILAKILFLPNYLLILKNTLNRQLKDLNEVSIMTNEIINI